VCLWRAVDHEAEVLDIVAQRGRGKAAALTLMRKLLKKQGFTDCHRDGEVAIVSSGVRGARSGGLAERCASSEPMKPLAAIFMNFICRGAQFRRAFIRAARLLAYRGSVLARIR
jgi:hypothetical protein